MNTITNKRHKYLSNITLSLFILFASATVQSQEFGFDPDVGGTVNAMAVQDDGKIFITGSFGSVSGVSRRYLARLRVSGIVDLSFDPELSFNGNALAIQSDGKLIVVGRFLGASDANASFVRNRIVRFNTDGSVDSDFDPDVNGEVYAVLIQDDGKILIAGTFRRVGGVLRVGLARLNTDGSVDDSFADPAIGENAVLTMALQGDGKIVVGGDFITVNGQVRNRVARINSDGSLDSAFVGPEVDDDVTALAIQDDGKIVIGGVFFLSIGQTPSQGIARLEADGSLDTAFKFSNSGGGGGPRILGVDAIVLQDDGRMLVGGQWFNLLGRDLGRLVRLQENGNVDLDFNPAVQSSSVSGSVKTMLIQDDSKILIGGAFGEVDSLKRRGMARINMNGSVEGVPKQTCTPIKAANGAVAVVCL